MTREEAIEILKNTAWLGTDKDREQTEEAVEMAISALNSLEEVYAKGYDDGFTQAEVNYENDKALEQNESAEKWYKLFVEKLDELEPCTDAVRVCEIYADVNDCENGAQELCGQCIHYKEPCDDAISRDMALEKMADYVASGYADSAEDFEEYSRIICQLPPVTQKAGKCKECKYFEYDSVAKVDGIPLIVAHEICNKWGDGCKTSEDGYCFLFEPQERSKE